MDIVSFEDGRIKLNNNNSQNLRSIRENLEKITQRPWVFEFDDSQKGISPGKQEYEANKANIRNIKENKLVKSILKNFPELQIDDIKI